MFLQDLFEEVRPNYLYHSTSAWTAEDILTANALEPKTDHLARKHLALRSKDVNKFDKAFGVSLTRSYRFAKNWRGGEVVFVLDATKIRHNHRLIPVDYYGRRQEDEEFAIGGIKNLEDYIVSIEIKEPVYEREKYDIEPGDPQKYPKEPLNCPTLLSHPKLKITP